MPTPGAVEMPAWAMSLIATVIIALIALAWRDQRQRTDDLKKQLELISGKLEGHVVADNHAHTRITVLETKVEQHGLTIQENYNKFHRFQVEMRDRADQTYKWLVEQFVKIHEFITEKVIASREK